MSDPAPQPSPQATLDQLEKLLSGLVVQLRQGRIEEVLSALPSAGGMIDALAALPRAQLNGLAEQLGRIAALHDALHMSLAERRQDLAGQLAHGRRGKAVLDVYRRAAGR